MPARSAPWWRDAVVYQIYPRSFQDSDGDGEGDLRGIASRLDHIASLGVDAIWLSPFYPSPMADGGYDVADYFDVDPRFGTLADLDALIAGAHARGLKVLLDVVPCHTSIAHPWFREHPDWYVWSDRDGPQNNWTATFGGRAWSRDEQTGRWYLHSFYPEQPDLEWRNPEVREAMADVLRFWRERGADGFRLDALQGLMKDPELRDDPPATTAFPLPLHPQHATLEHRHSTSARDVGVALEAFRDAAGDDAFLAGEVYVPTAGLAPYLEHLDVCFGFELFHARWGADVVRAAIEAAEHVGPGRVAWMLSNHDFPRLPTRVGEHNVRAAALLLLTLPGAVFMFQGDELGMPDGPGRDGPPDDRYGRDPCRHPMPWSDAEPHGGFTTGTPWLPALDIPGASAREQEDDPGSMLHLYRDLVALRRTLGEGIELLEADEGVVAYRRGTDHVVALNLAGEPRPAPPAGAPIRRTHEASDWPPRTLRPGEGFLARSAG